ncbi:MAG TPA: methionyl-tRNA formyltransferase [Polyangiaceae bacterium]|nr:methionyl-tRNA formyltransferase [Polyangiaceae bacterium]
MVGPVRRDRSGIWYTSPVRAVFFGTPAIAVPALRALAEVAEVVGVVCQPDRPAGRGLNLQPPAVKVAALELGLEVHQPLKVKTGNLDEWLRERTPDVALVMAYGRILPLAVLAAPTRGCMNLHASLLPRWRGAAPINWSIIHGDHETGICLMQMDEGLDTGPVYARRAISIGDDETAGELAERLAATSVQLVREELVRAVAGELEAVPQEHDKSTHAPPLERADGALLFSKPARDLVNLVRGLAPRPGAHTLLDGKPLKIAQARRSDRPAAGEPGTVRVEGKRVLISTIDGSFELVRAQLEGRKELPALDLINGRALKPGDVLGQ